MRAVSAVGLVLVLAAGSAFAQEARITVHADQVQRRISPYLTGACIEDVNHEIYGGIYSQMVFGESFQEPAPPAPIPGFKAYGGDWRVLAAGELSAAGGDGPKLVSEHEAFADGEVGVEILLPDKSGGNAGLIVKVTGPGVGADTFDGYEVALDAAGQQLRLGRHRHNWEHIRDVPCVVPTGEWIPLVVRMSGASLEIEVAGRRIVTYEDREHPLGPGRVGLRPWQRVARFRNLWIKAGEKTVPLPFERSSDDRSEVSGMWRQVRRGSASGSSGFETRQPFTGRQSQRLTFESGSGEFGIENQGLNRWGMSFAAGRAYEGYLWARAEKAADLWVALERRDGTRVYAEAGVAVPAGEWRRLDFALTPGETDAAGRLAIKLKAPGSVVLGHVFLQPGEWGRFKGLAVRRDVVEALIDQGITVLRYGGSMINHPEYRWKKMIGPRDRRPPHVGTWYPYSSNGWGIIDFLSLCEAAGFLAIPAFNMGESPRDMADFIEYVNGSVESEWGRRRAADGHPAPFGLRHIQLGNEERVDEAYVQKFKPLAEAIWARDPQMILVVGDFLYTQPINDPFRFTGSASGITSLAAHQQILELARAHDREVWFDVHVGTEGPGASAEMTALSSLVEAMGRIASGARHHVVVFEFNAGNHQHRRALANAQAIHLVERLGLPVAASANCLQPDGQNDNGWDQGLLFLNPSQVWLQPPGYVTRMISRQYQPLLVRSEAAGAAGKLDVSAKRSEDGRTLVVQAVNLAAEPMPVTLRIHGFRPAQAEADVEELAAPLDATNTAEVPNRVRPAARTWRHDMSNGEARLTLAPHSFTVIRLE